MTRIDRFFSSFSFYKYETDETHKLITQKETHRIYFFFLKAIILVGRF